MKIAVYIDSLTSVSGATKAAVEIAKRLEADIITCGVDPKLMEFFQIKNKVIDIGNISGRIFSPLSFYIEEPLRFLLFKSPKYDLHLFAGSTCILAASKRNTNLWFCFTPNRTLYDLREWELRHASFLKGLIIWIHVAVSSYFDNSRVKNIQNIIAVSKTVQKRIKKYYNRVSLVIHPPTDTSKFKFNKFGDYYLAVSRLYPHKRMLLIAETFAGLKNKKLILVGDGPQSNEIERVISGHSNIKLYKNVSEAELRKLYADCLAVIFLPMLEDFGLIPVEAMASGKICIVSNEGGCKETVLDKKTGFIIQPSEQSLRKLVLKLNLNLVSSMKQECLKRAAYFDSRRIIKQLKNFITQGFKHN